MKPCKICGKDTIGTVTGEPVCTKCYIWGWKPAREIQKTITKVRRIK